MPGYDQNGWVAVHAYQRRDWGELIELWQALNRQLLAAAEAVPDSAWSRTLTVAGSEPLTLQFVFEDYVAHMLHHLQHIGIEVDDQIENNERSLSFRLLLGSAAVHCCDDWLFSESALAAEVRFNSHDQGQE
jgi:hypothetical protein